MFYFAMYNLFSVFSFNYIEAFSLRLISSDQICNKLTSDAIFHIYLKQLGVLYASNDLFCNICMLHQVFLDVQNSVVKLMLIY